MICPDCERPMVYDYDDRHTPQMSVCYAAGLGHYCGPALDCLRLTVARLRARHYCPQCTCGDCARERAKEVHE